jgi:hypothetical protein
MVAADLIMVSEGADDTYGDSLLTGVGVDESRHLPGPVRPQRFGIEAPGDEHPEERAVIEESLQFGR